MIKKCIAIGLLAVLAFIASPGCHRATATDHDHLEHHVPPHKPANVAAAIDQIEHRFEAMAHGERTRGSERVTELKELVDIVRWLPEIAGDSDLREPQWNTVDQISEKLWPPLLDQLQRAERGEVANLQPIHDLVDASLAELRDATRDLPVEPTVANTLNHGHSDGHTHD